MKLYLRMQKPHDLSQVTEVTPLSRGRGECQSLDSWPMSSAERAAASWLSTEEPGVATDALDGPQKVFGRLLRAPWRPRIYGSWGSVPSSTLRNIFTNGLLKKQRKGP